MSTEDIERCLEACQADDPAKRSEALFALNELETPLSIPIMINLLSKDPDAEVRADAAFLLRPLDETNTVAAGPTLLKALNDEDKKVRNNAAETLGYLYYLPAIERLRVLLHTDVAWFVRTSAAEALGRMKDDASIPDLRRAVDDPHAEVQKAAIVALGQFIGSTDLAALVAKNLSDDQQDPGVRAEWLSLSYRLGQRSHLQDLLTLLEQTDDYEQATSVLMVLYELAERNSVADLKNHRVVIQATLQRFLLKHPSLRSDVEKILQNIER